jgi:hypothetical protein
MRVFQTGGSRPAATRAPRRCEKELHETIWPSLTSHPVRDARHPAGALLLVADGPLGEYTARGADGEDSRFRFEMLVGLIALVQKAADLIAPAIAPCGLAGRDGNVRKDLRVRQIEERVKVTRLPTFEDAFHDPDSRVFHRAAVSQRRIDGSKPFCGAPS